jgi:hypothetical protein
MLSGHVLVFCTLLTPWLLVLLLMLALLLLLLLCCCCDV